MKKELFHGRNLRRYELGAAVLLLAVLVVWGLALHLSEPDREATAARKISKYVTGRS